VTRAPIVYEDGSRVEFREERADGTLEAVRYASSESALGAVGTFDEGTGEFRAYGPDNLPPHIDPHAPPVSLEDLGGRPLSDAEAAAAGLPSELPGEFR